MDFSLWAKLQLYGPIAQMEIKARETDCESCIYTSWTRRIDRPDSSRQGGPKTLMKDIAVKWVSDVCAYAHRHRPQLPKTLKGPGRKPQASHTPSAVYLIPCRQLFLLLLLAPSSLLLTVALSLRTHSRGQPLEKLPPPARGLPPSRTALNRDIVSFVLGPEHCFSHQSAAVNTPKSSEEGLGSSTAGKDANTAPIKGMVMKERGNGEPVISIQWVAVKGCLECPVGLCKSSRRMHMCVMCC